nr:NADH dehydrogenase subunit 5 [Ceratocombus sp. HL-2012]
MKFFGLYKISSFFLFFLGFFLFLFGVIFLWLDYLVVLDWEILTLNSCVLSFSILLDWMSFMFLGFVMLISSMVLLYSSSYMVGDFNGSRFCLLVILFILSMMFLILSPNMISILLGWDGLGLISYCLVIYFQNSMSYMSGLLTILMNRLGDVAILVSIILFFSFGNWIFIFYFFSGDYIFYFLFCLVVLASFTKSAQIPFSSWLPAAMAAPTPVSALVHSSTLVTAGVYLLIRYSFLLYQFNCSFFMMISLITMFMSGLGANFEFDLKKIIALSTLSQLGLMMSLLFLGCSVFSFFHLLTHAFFKSLLFLCAGLIIHVMGDSQDIRYMGGVSNLLYFTSICFCISNLSLCGFPFLSGFYSKDLMVEFYSYDGFSGLFYFLYYFSLGLTVSYSVRLIYYLFLGDLNMFMYNSYFEDFTMIFSMFFLVIMSIISGSLLFWLMFSFSYYLILPIIMKLLVFFMIVGGVLLGYLNSYFFVLNKSKALNLLLFFSSMWFMSLYNFMFMNVMNKYSSNYFVTVELGWSEMFYSSMFFNVFSFYSNLYSFVQLNGIKIFMFMYFLIIFYILY